MIHSEIYQRANVSWCTNKIKCKKQNMKHTTTHNNAPAILTF